MSQASLTRWSRWFVGAGAVFFVAWGFAAALGLGRRPEVTFALYGFVLHTVFGKGYSLVPSYFDRRLAVPRAPAVHLPLSVVGTVALASAGLPGVPQAATAVGAVLWTAGVAVFLAALLWTVRDNLTGAETGTGAGKAERRPVDRFANAFVPVVLAYLAAGTYELLAATLGLPTLLDGVMAQITHLLAAGVAALLVFAVGFRLFPRFLVEHPPKPLVWVVLSAGALAPASIAAGLFGGPLLLAGAALATVAVVGWAVGYALLFWRSDRRRVGLYAVLVGAGGGVVAVAIALHLALVARDPALVQAHYRFTLVGFLGLTVVGAAAQFYPPSVGEWPGASDEAMAWTVLAVAGGLVVQLFGVSVHAFLHVGEIIALAGTLGYAYLLLGAFVTRAR